MGSSARLAHILARFAAVAALTAVGVAGTSAAAFALDVEHIISNDNMRAANSMSVAQIQAFLETQTGPLATLETSDYDKVITTSTDKPNVNLTPDTAEAKKPASQIIWEACQAWQISPKVMLTMLQKEQSLLTRTSLDKNTLARAIGAGCPNSTTNRYPGFGNQMWHGARLLSSYGEGHSAFPTFYYGISKTIYKHPDYGTKIHPENLATFKLYVYNPSIPGNTNFYNIYRRYFGSTFANPRYRTVWRFRKTTNGSYLYTTSIAERYKLRYTSRKRYWEYAGPKFSVDASVATTATVPLYRFYNKLTRKYSFTTSKTKYEQRRTTAGRRTWDYQGVAYRVAKTKTPDAVTIYKFRYRRTGAYLHTDSSALLKEYKSSSAFRKKWAYEGIGYYLPRLESEVSSPTTPTAPETSTPAGP